MADWDTLFVDAPHAGPGAALREPERGPHSPSRIRIDPDNVRNGLLQLALTLVELIRELLERQALRRVDSGSLTPAEVERLGQTLWRLSTEMEGLKKQFGFSDEDLNLNLGPLGTLR